MQTFYEDEAITIRPNQDGHLLSDFQHALGDLLNNLWFERCAAFYRYVDVCDRKFFSPHHGTSPKCANEKSCQSRTVSKTLFQAHRSEAVIASTPDARQPGLSFARQSGGAVIVINLNESGG